MNPGFEVGQRMKTVISDHSFYRATQLCYRGIGSCNFDRLSVRPSVRLSVRLSHACFVTNLKNLLAIFLYHMKGQSF